ncbi:HhH-GPD family protein [Parvibacter caecicola]|uniref:Adenine DNA glycosylase n=1 Tax=Parvibacter caecicola TaxID=747645 RepID=A0A7W5D0Q8_9ACTN|nr:adenine glycosylase [Parvibacter caecicola]MBB3170525.1 A/G-specific adenine glycosylase [Parvibacter caecicola]MCR2041513.1 adenine glycosylase [Parvibacter caecicola]RNL12089.1 adenine glycosylase [Parvibacter caecicola]
MTKSSPNIAWGEAALSRPQFIEQVWQEGRAAYRELPWRNIDDPFAVLVSEVMLQQTQVARVLNFWPRFMAAFPTADALAAASSADVLEHWQGLGYNRRALLLKRAAEVCAATLQGQLPRSYDELLALPGVGPATAAGVCNFAYRTAAPYLETNVRSVFLHLLFPSQENVADRQLMPLVADCAATEEPRGWNYALLDLGARLKAETANPSRRSASYARQSPFAGSNRQKRAALLRCVLAHPEGIAAAQAWQLVDEELARAGVAPADERLKGEIAAQLQREGFFRCECGLLRP